MSWHDSDGEPRDAVDDMNGLHRRAQSDHQDDWGDGIEDADSEYWEDVLDASEDSDIDNPDEGDEQSGDSIDTNDNQDFSTNSEPKPQEQKILVAFQYRNGSPGISIHDKRENLTEFNYLNQKTIYEGSIDSCDAIKRGFNKTRRALNTAGFQGKTLCTLTDQIILKLIQATQHCEPTSDDEDRQALTDQWMYACLLHLTCEISIGGALADVIRNELRRELITNGRDVSYAKQKKSTYKRFDQARFKTEQPEMYEQYLREVTAYSVELIPPNAPISLSLDEINQLMDKSFATTGDSRMEPKQTPQAATNSDNMPPSTTDSFHSFDEAASAAQHLSKEQRVYAYVLCTREGFFLSRKSAVWTRPK